MQCQDCAVDLSRHLGLDKSVNTTVTVYEVAAVTVNSTSWRIPTSRRQFS